MRASYLVFVGLVALPITFVNLPARAVTNDSYSVTLSTGQQHAIISLTKELAHDSPKERALARKKVETLSLNARCVLVAILLTFDDPELLATARKVEKADSIVVAPADSDATSRDRTPAVSAKEVMLVAQQCGLLAKRKALAQTYARRHPRVHSLDNKLESISERLKRLRSSKHAEQSPGGDSQKAAPQE